MSVAPVSARWLAPVLCALTVTMMTMSTTLGADEGDKEEGVQCEKDEECVVVYAPEKGGGGSSGLTWYIPTKKGWAEGRFNTEIKFDRGTLEGKGLSAAIACREAMEMFMHNAARVVERQGDPAELAKYTKRRDEWQQAVLGEKCEGLLPDAKEFAEQLSNVYTPQ